MKPYFYVQRVGDRAAVVKHPTAEAAVTEAERLAKRHPGEHFAILQCIAVTSVTVPEPNTFWMDGCGPEPEPEWKFDWSKINPDHNNAAMDNDGRWWSFEETPKRIHAKLGWDDGSITCEEFDYPPFPGDWKDSLQVRPEPDEPDTLQPDPKNNLPAAPEGWHGPIQGPLKGVNGVAMKDIAGWNEGKWSFGCWSGVSYMIYAIRKGSEIAKLNGLEP